MNQPCFQTSDWYQAIALESRVTSLKAVPDKKINAEVNSELARRRLQRWRSQPPFNDDSHFRQRLSIDGISEDEFFYLLGEPIAAVQKRCSSSPSWLKNLEETFSDATSFDRKSLPSQEEVKGREIGLFLYAIEPLIQQGRNKFDREVQKLNKTQKELPFDSTKVIDIFYANLPKQLLGICSRTMVLELQVAGLQGVLQGNTSQERFSSFIQYLCQRDRLLALLQEYPILARQLIICIEHWVNFSLEFLTHLSADWREIKNTFSPNKDSGELLEIQGSEGDSHRQGRSVIIAKFSSGFQLVYKPRSLSVDIHFQQLLTWLNERGANPSFKTINILNRDSHGWVEFITPASCSNQEEIHRFYQRQGGYLALLYILEAVDFHNENSIAAGEHPILVDLESLFHPRVSKNNSTQLNLLANETLDRSVLRVGLLPQKIWSDGEKDGIDISGLGGKEGQITPYELPYWEEVGTDQMRLKRKQMVIPAQNNLPQLNGSAIDVLDYADDLTAGFTQVYQILKKYRDELLDRDSPITAFSGDRVRVILRPTRLYAVLLVDSFHPKMLRDALERERLFDRLWFGFEHQPYLAKLIPAERTDLWNGDIPIFTTHPNSCDLLTSFEETIPNFFEKSGLDLVRDRLQQLHESDLLLQTRIIKASLASLSIAKEQGKYSRYSLSEPKSKVDREKLLEAARSVGDRLEELALRGEDNVSWIILKPMRERYHAIASSGIDFYEGLPGITLFLAYLGIITKEQRYTSLAQVAFQTLRHQVEQGKAFLKSIGAFDGWGGIIYTLTNLGVLWNQPELLTEAEELVKLLPPLIEKDKGLDLIAGSAGCILSLLSLYRCSPSQSTLAAAIACGDRLIAEAQQMPQGIGWIIPDPEPNSEAKPLAGIGHGAAGIAAALLELASITGQERFRSVALAGIAYERSLFLPKEGNWPDLRYFSDRVKSGNNNQHDCMTAWCHGAPGIGLARLRSLPYLDDIQIKTEIDTALKTTVNNGFGYNHSLCHGDLGNLELLLTASLTLDNPQWKDRVDRFAAIILESIDRDGWLCGVPWGIETPGLMVGLAGIGYGLLRLAEPDFVPSVLMLESPLKGLGTRD
jgi:type 2 lantibiotic biosynthesis protein LanM